MTTAAPIQYDNSTEICSSRVGLGWVGLGWVGLGWVGLGRVGLTTIANIHQGEFLACAFSMVVVMGKLDGSTLALRPILRI